MSNTNEDQETIIDKIKRVAPPLEEYIDTSGREWERISSTEIRGPHPIHGSTTGTNFVINTETQTWYCYRMGHESGGSIIDFIAMEESIIKCEEAGNIPSDKWSEVFHACCEEFDIENDLEGIDEEKLKKMREKRKKQEEVYNILTEFSELAHDRIDHVSWNDKTVREHLKEKRAFSDSIIDDLKIGFWDGKVTEELVEINDIGDLIRSGLFVIPSKLNEKMDDATQLSPQGFNKPLSGRIIYPYWKGKKVVYLIGRKTPRTDWENGPKYIKLSSGEKHDEVSDAIKNDVFYAEDYARSEQLLITEGVTDCISLLDAGYNAVSPVTTRFREEDKSKIIDLTKYSDEVVIINDNEKSKAGEEGALKTAKVLFNADRNVKIAFPPRPKDENKVDVDDYLTEHDNSLEAVKNMLNNAKYYIDYRIDKLTEGDVDGITEILKELKGKDYMFIDYALNKLEKKACVSKEVLRRKFRGLGGEDPIEID